MIKLLAITDDVRLMTGVGIQANKLLLGLQKTGLFKISQIGGSLIQQNPSPLEFSGITIYPVSNGFGNAQHLRYVIQKEKPDIILAFSDPRFFMYVFGMDNEIRKYSKLILYHTWDNEPFPTYNIPYYNSCDYIATLSKFSHELLKKGGQQNTFISHGFDPQEFYKLKEGEILRERESLCEKVVGRKNVDFIVFWNNRNLHRKRPGDVLRAFDIFHKRFPSSFLLMNTTSFDVDGNDLHHLVRDGIFDDNMLVVMNDSKVNSESLNIFYNIADVTINISNNEGFGLCVGESLLTETPVIATKTGGMIEQLSDDKIKYGILMDPAVKELFGIPGAPYIYRDYVSYDQIVSALIAVYNGKDFYNKKAALGREHIIKNYNVKNTVEKWKNFLIEVYNSESKYKPYEVISI
jgi:glycosyltransferase involved in cell wall biosynthesis